MKKNRFFTMILVLLVMSGCIPAGDGTVDAPTAASPTTAVPPTLTPASTHTPEPATATPEDAPAAGLVLPSMDLAAQSAVLVDALTGDVLYEKNAHQRMYPASTTKIMTALLALEYFRTDEIIRVGEESNLTWTAERIDAQKAGLYYGQELAMRELLYGLLLASGSDAAFTIAANVARRESGEIFMDDQQAVIYFSELMNRKAAVIGAAETNFTNPDGIQDPNHYSTAFDLALIARAAMQDTQFREIVATTVYETAQTITESGGVYSRSWENTNKLIQPEDVHYYAPANGIKTGTTPEAGHCLVSSAMVGSDLFIAVVLGSTQEGVWSDAAMLLEYAKENRS